MSPLALSLRFLQTQPDSRLVELSRAGHERAFEALVQRYRRQLLVYCRRITSSDAGAEDALQQALLQAWVALSTTDVEVRDARAWLYRIVHNVAVSNLRRPSHDAVEMDDAEGVSGADHEVERRFEVRQALAGLASLPELQRQVMLSTALEGRSHDEIASALGLSHGAVRGLIYRARATLRAAAAAITPAPVVHWAVRQQASGAGRSAGMYEAIAGGGGAGLGGVLLKGGALVVSAGALATAAGISVSNEHRHVTQQAIVASTLKRGGHGAAHHAAAGSGAAANFVAAAAGTAGSAAGGRARSEHRSGHGRGRGRGGPDRHNGASIPFASRSGSGGRRRGGSDGGGGSGSRHHGGTDGGSGGGSSGGSGSDGGGSGGGNGHDGGSGLLTSGRGSGGDNGGGGEGSTPSGTTTATSSTTGSGGGHDGGSGGGGDGGDRGGGSTTTGTVTTVTTTSTTTSGSATSGD